MTAARLPEFDQHRHPACATTLAKSRSVTSPIMTQPSPTPSGDLPQKKRTTARTATGRTAHSRSVVRWSPSFE